MKDLKRAQLEKEQQPSLIINILSPMVKHICIYRDGKRARYNEERKQGAMEE